MGVAHDIVTSPLAGVVVGAAATTWGGFFGNRWLERSRQQHQLRAMGNERLFSAALDFSQSGREMWHVACETKRNGHPGYDDELETLQLRLRSLYAHVRLVGDAGVQDRARRVVREAYAARIVATGGADPRPTPGEEAQQRLNRELVAFLTAARHQLETTDPDAVPQLDIEDDY